MQQDVDSPSQQVADTQAKHAATLADSNSSVLNVSRAIRQHLKSLQRAGLTHLPRHQTSTEIEIAEQGQPNSEITATETSTAAMASTGLTNSSSQSETVSTPRQSLLPELEPPRPTIQTTGSTTVPSTPRCTLSRSERQEKLNELSQKVTVCTRCRELAETRTNTVFGVGNPEASIMFIGEAPGADEDKQGEPFVGRAGKLLNSIIEACQLKREEIYICNILRCRPPGNRNPDSEEATNCREYLDGQIDLVDPDYIVCLGTVAAQNLLDTTTPIGKLRGRFLEHGRSKVLCTYHPSYLLRNPPAKKHVWDDMKFLFHDMGVDLDT